MAEKRIKNEALQRGMLTSFKETKNYIVNKYYNIFMNKLDVQGADYQQRDFLLRQFWASGTVAMFIIKGTQNTEEAPEGLACFCGYAPIDYNTYDFPVHCTLINKRGVPFIPSGIQEIDKDVIIGFVQRNKKSIKFIVEYRAKKIALIKSVIQTQLLVQKMPFLLATTPENKAQMEALWNELLSDFPVLYKDVDVINNINALQLGGVFNVDKLEALADAEENKLKEELGLTNLGVNEKKEHLIGKEVDANNEVTEEGASCFIDCLAEMSQQAKEVLNYTLTFSWKNSPKAEAEEGEDAPDEDEEESEDE